EPRHRQTDALTREKLEGPQFVARARNGNALVERIDSHHFELAYDRGSVERDGRSDTGDHGVVSRQFFALVANGWVVRRDVHVAAQRVDDAYLVASHFGRLRQAPGRVEIGAARENTDLHGSTYPVLRLDESGAETVCR